MSLEKPTLEAQTSTESVEKETKVGLAYVPEEVEVDVFDNKKFVQKSTINEVEKSLTISSADRYFSNVSLGDDVNEISITPKDRPEYIKYSDYRHPFDESNILKWLFINKILNWWNRDLLKVGSKRAIKLHDIWNVPKSCDLDMLIKLWKDGILYFKNNKQQISLWKLLKRLHGKTIIITFFMTEIVLLSSLMVPFIISRLAQFYENDSEKNGKQPIRTGIYLTIALFCLGAFRSIGMNLIFQYLTQITTRIKLQLMYCIYDKTLNMSLTANNSHSSTGKKVNMISSDVTSIGLFLGIGPLFFANVLFIFFVLAAFINVVGVAGLAGWGFMVLTIPLQMIVGKKIANARRKMMISSDARVKFISELLTGIRVTKIYAWEMALMDQVSIFRNEEMKRLRLKIKNMALFSALNFLIPPSVALLILMTYSLMGNKLSVGKVFAVVTLISLMRISIRIFPYLAMLFVQSKVGISRIESYLSLSEISNTNRVSGLPLDSDYNNNNNNNDSLIISIKNGSFSWKDDNSTTTENIDPKNKLLSNSKSVKITIDKEKEKMNIKRTKEFELSNINLNIYNGELIAIVGTVGSGKSSLFNAILGEMKCINGDIKIYNDSFIGYCPQQSFIVNATLRENILMGKPYKRSFYQKTVLASALLHDINILANSDLTEIGERGINLSGGQKSRIQFARALYRSRDCNILLFDDPLSAVDTEVGNTMWNEGIMKLLSTKTRIIIMNSHLHLLQFVDKILVLNEGKIVASGTYNDIIENSDYKHLLPSKKESERSNNKSLNNKKENKKQTKLFFEKQKMIKHSRNQNTIRLELDKMMDKAGRQNEKGKLTRKEERVVGSISFDVYTRYFNNAATQFNWYDKDAGKSDSKSVFGTFIIVLEIILIILTQGCQSGGDIWMSLWSSEEEKQRFPNKSQGWWIGNWALFIVGLALFGFGTSYLFGIVSTRASVNLHMRVLYSVLKAPLLYFDSTPVGRILNRFGKDTAVMDDELPLHLNTLLGNGMLLFGYLMVICVTLPHILVVLLFAVPLFWYHQHFYRKGSRELKRLEHMSVGPLVSQFSETLGGLDTIRAYNLNGQFISKYKSHLKDNAKVFLQGQLSSRWFALYLDLLVLSIVVCVCLIGVFLRDTLDTALLTLAVVYAQGFTGILQWTVRTSVDVESGFTSVERLLFYENSIKDSDKDKDKENVSGIPREYDAINFDYRPSNQLTNRKDKTWPFEGKIIFKNLKMRYRKDLDLVLKGIDCTINPGEKVGICGRTGAGKSSLMVVLFRLVEPEINSSIIIDGLDCLKLGLRDLRSNLSIIPQDPVLFSGTLRFNLDPFNEYSDNKIWDILKKIQLYDSIKNKNNGLNCIVSEGGNNFSQGEKQLICIGRALLKNSKILLLDEATSSIDKFTDNLIQKLIRSYFSGITVLTIAHRLETILDYDRIMVLSEGKIIEFDKPEILMKKKDGAFAQMINQKKDSQSKQEIDMSLVVDIDIQEQL